MSEGLTQVQRTYWGRFANPWSTWVDTRIRAGLHLVFTKGDPDCSPSRHDPRLDQLLPVYTPKFGNDGDKGVRLTWLGHASTLVQVDGVRVIFDPIFSERCSASPYIGPLRYRLPPCKVSVLPSLM